MTMKSDIEVNRMPQNDIAIGWAAGFFDGDGCTSISKQQVKGRKNLTYRLRLYIAQNCKETLLHFKRVVDVHAFITTPGPKLENNKQMFTLVYEGWHAIAALEKLAPHLVRKKHGAQAAMLFWQEGRMGTLPGCNGFGPEVWKKRAYWFKKLRMLDKR